MATMNQSGSAGVNYLSITGGKFRQRLAEDSSNPNAVKRKLTFGPNEGSYVKELEFSNVEGFITNLEIKKNEFGGKEITSLAVSLDDNLVINFGEVQMDNVTNTLINIDFSKKVKVSAYLKDDKNQFSFEQDGEWVKWGVTRDTPMDCPAPTKKMVKGAEKWDYSERSEWFYAKLETIIAEKFPNGRITTPEGAEYNSEVIEDDGGYEEGEYRATPASTVNNGEDDISVEDIPF